MDFDLLIKNVNSSDGQNGVDIAFNNGKIIAIECGI